MHPTAAAAESVRDFAARSTRSSVVVGTPQAAELAAVLTAAGASVEPEGSTGVEKLAMTGLPADRIGALAFDNGIQLNELTARTALEAAFVTPPPAEAGGFSLRRVGVATDQPGP
ncbi:hypothetical protein ACIRVK_41695 [Streptomyces sp. NPDC101152]|uniref:hypothetical protein n=1 Tax=Streptomyces sp. NPDC101152 TaxID=3366116 RepID=UPI00380D0520